MCEFGALCTTAYTASVALLAQQTKLICNNLVRIILYIHTPVSHIVKPHFTHYSTPPPPPSFMP